MANQLPGSVSRDVLNRPQKASNCGTEAKQNGISIYSSARTATALCDSSVARDKLVAESIFKRNCLLEDLSHFSFRLRFAFLLL